MDEDFFIYVFDHLHYYRNMRLKNIPSSDKVILNITKC